MLIYFHGKSLTSCLCRTSLSLVTPDLGFVLGFLRFSECLLVENVQKVGISLPGISFIFSSRN